MKTKSKPPPRLCGVNAYCGALRAAGIAGPLCPHCEAVARALAFYERTLAKGRA